MSQITTRLERLEHGQEPEDRIKAIILTFRASGDSAPVNSGNAVAWFPGMNIPSLSKSLADTYDEFSGRVAKISAQVTQAIKSDAASKKAVKAALAHEIEFANARCN